MWKTIYQTKKCLIKSSDSGLDLPISDDFYATNTRKRAIRQILHWERRSQYKKTSSDRARNIVCRLFPSFSHTGLFWTNYEQFSNNRFFEDNYLIKFVDKLLLYLRGSWPSLGTAGFWIQLCLLACHLPDPRSTSRQSGTECLNCHWNRAPWLLAHGYVGTTFIRWWMLGAPLKRFGSLLIFGRSGTLVMKIKPQQKGIPQRFSEVLSETLSETLSEADCPLGDSRPCCP